MNNNKLELGSPNPPPPFLTCSMILSIGSNVGHQTRQGLMNMITTFQCTIHIKTLEETSN